MSSCFSSSPISLLLGGSTTFPTSFLFVCAFLLVGSLGTANAQRPPATTQQQYERLAQEAAALQRHHALLKMVIKVVAPSVAHVEAKKRQPSSAASHQQRGKQTPVVIEEAGSGIVIQRNGRFYVVTNYHVVEDSLARDILIEVEGQVYHPVRLMHDRQTDLSVMALAETDLTPAHLGDSSTLEMGDFVIAVGSPFGLSHSVSYGIVSALHRHDLELGPQGVRYQNFIQTDAAINPGNSGGPLINLRGEIVGINTAIASNSGGSDGIGFSIPMNMVVRIVDDLIDYGHVRRGFLGVALDSQFSYEKANAIGLKKSYGALVSAITPHSPAAEAGLQVGDVILEFNGIRVANDSHLVTQVSLAPIRSTAILKIYRGRQYKNIAITINDRRSFSPRH